MWNYSNSRCNNARTYVHSDQFQKMSCFCAKTLFFYWSMAIKIKTLPSAFLLRISFCFSFHLFEHALLWLKKQQKCQTLFGILAFYSFTIIGYHFVLCFYDGNKQHSLLTATMGESIHSRYNIFIHFEIPAADSMILKGRQFIAKIFFVLWANYSLRWKCSFSVEIW